MKKQIEIILYNEEWPIQFASEAKVLKDALGNQCLAIHHIGSTAIPGLTAKSKIDIIAVVKNAQTCIPLLEQAGYTYKGEWHIPFKYGFTKRDDVNINLHVFEEGHSDIEMNLLFRDYLRHHSDAVAEYANLKTELLKDSDAHQKQNNRMFPGYTLGKDSFLRNILAKAGFDKLRFTHCVHDYEWEAYHRIAKAKIFDPIHVEYDRNHPSMTAENYYHFVLCKGITVVAVAAIEFMDQDIAALRILATDKDFQKQGFASYMLQLLEKWIKIKGRKTIKLHARLGTELFYGKFGYQEMPFDDSSISDNIIDLGKVL